MFGSLLVRFIIWFWCSGRGIGSMCRGGFVVAAGSVGMGSVACFGLGWVAGFCLVVAGCIFFVFLGVVFFVGIWFSGVVF